MKIFQKEIPEILINNELQRMEMILRTRQKVNEKTTTQNMVSGFGTATLQILQAGLFAFDFELQNN